MNPEIANKATFNERFEAFVDDALPMLRKLRRETGVLIPLLFAHVSKPVEGKEWIMTDLSAFFEDSDSKNRLAEIAPGFAQQVKAKAVVVVNEAWSVRPNVTKEELDQWLENNDSLGKHPEALDVVLVRYEEPGRDAFVVYEAFEDGTMSPEPLFNSMEIDDGEDNAENVYRYSRLQFFPDPPGLSA